MRTCPGRGVTPLTPIRGRPSGYTTSITALVCVQQSVPHRRLLCARRGRGGASVASLPSQPPGRPALRSQHTLGTQPALYMVSLSLPDYLFGSPEGLAALYPPLGVSDTSCRLTAGWPLGVCPPPGGGGGTKGTSLPPLSLFFNISWACSSFLLPYTPFLFFLSSLPPLISFPP